MHIDGGVYSVANAYHAASKDELTTLNFDPARIRKHLIDCFTLKSFHHFQQKRASHQEDA